MMPMRSSATFGSLFTGIGGIDLGLEEAGWSCRWQSEIDPYACRVLAKQYPHLPNLGDITTIDWSTVERVDLLCGGFPCQDISSARTRNARRGLDGHKSGLWSAFAAAVGVLGPTWVVVENSPEWHRWVPDVRRDLHWLGYASLSLLLSAGSFGAPHKRPRGVVVAHADSQGEPLRAIHAEVARLPQVPGRGRADLWSTAPPVVGVGDGIPSRMDRLRCLGNAASPPVFEWLGRRIKEAA